MIDGIKYYASAVLFVILCFLDAFFILMFIYAVSKEDAGGIIGVLFFLLPLLLAAKKCYSYHKKINFKKRSSAKPISVSVEDDEHDEPIGFSGKKNPEYEITYTDYEGERTTRKISVLKFDGKSIESFCFLRGEERTFYIKRISECVDLSTGEVVNEDLRQFFAKKFNMNLKPCDMYDFDEWAEMSYSQVPELPGDLHGFELNEKIKMTIVTFNDGFINDEFVCEKVYSSSYESDQFYIVMYNSKGERFNVGLSKIVSVDGVDDFAKYLESKFYESDSGKSSMLLQRFSAELSILVYLGRADASLTAAKRNVICDYLNGIGAETSEDIVAKVGRRIKVDTAEFKKIVNAFSKIIPEDRKNAFVKAAELVVGGRAKAKPFGLAGLQYIESKIK